MGKFAGILFSVMMFSVLGYLWYDVNEHMNYERPVIAQFDASYRMLLQDLSKSPMNTDTITSDLLRNFNDAQKMSDLYISGNNDLNAYKSYLVMVKVLSQANNIPSYLWQFEVSDTLRFLHDRTHNNF